ncbi:MAG: peptidylprolyl isomerase [Candidatus Bipolaricaulis sp.]|nr:peptidylprolyl isomerase [Candidatus Bipolaricaulis sp.]
MHGRLMGWIALLLATSLLLFACGKEPARTPASGTTPAPSASAPAAATPATAAKPAAVAPTPAPATPPAAAAEVPTTAAATAEASTEITPPAATAEAPEAAIETPEAATPAPAATAETSPEIAPPAATAEAPAAAVETPEAAAPSPAATAEAPATTPPPAETAPAETATAVSASTASTPAIDPGVAVVNEHVITSSRLDQATMAVLDYAKRLYAQFGINLATMLTGARGRVMDLEMEVQALENLVTQVIVDDEIARRGITVSDDEASAEFDRQFKEYLASQGLTEEEYVAKELAPRNLTLSQFREQARGTIRTQLINQELQRAVAGPIEISDEDLEAYWFENRATYDIEEQVRASHILVATEQSASEVLAALDSGADFAALAMERSSDTGSAAKGGDLGWFGRGQMVEAFEQAAFALAKGERSGVVQTNYGYHIILVVDRKEAVRHEFADVRDQVQEDLEEEQITEGATAWYNATRAAATITVNDPMLDAGWKKSQDIDLGLAAFERLYEEHLVEDPYLPFIIGSIYDTKMTDKSTERAALEAEASADPASVEKFSALTAEIDAARTKALSFYQIALASFSDDETILSRIEALSAEGGADSAI